MSPAVDPRAACIIGVARQTWHPADAPDGAPEPLAMWEEMARAAAADAGVPGALAALESIDVVFTQSWQYDDPAARLAERLGATSARLNYSGLGGSVPQVLASGTAAMMMDGHLDLALIVGAEALATVRRLKKAGEKPQWSFKPAERRPFPMDLQFHPSEISHAVFEAYLTFALFDNARRAHLGRGLDEHRAQLGRVLAPLTRVAAASPHAWFPIARSASEITTATPDNRMVAYPYTKLMTSIMDVDMSAALLLASAAKADALGVPEDKRVYLRGFGYAEDPAHVADHPDLWRSPAMATASSTRAGRRRYRHRRRRPLRPLLLLRQFGELRPRCPRPVRRRPSWRDPDGRSPLSRRPRFQLHDALHRRHGRDAAGRPRLLRRDQWCRDAHAEARLRPLVDCARRGAHGESDNAPSAGDSPP